MALEKNFPNGQTFLVVPICRLTYKSSDTLPPKLLLKSNKRHLHASGFTLLELLVVLIIVAILASLAAPNFINTLRQAGVTDAAQKLQITMMLARAESLKTGQRISIAPRVINNTAAWSNGWVTFVDEANAGILVPAARIVAEQEALDNTFFFFTNAPPPVSQPTGEPILSYRNGRPQQLNGALLPFRFVVGKTDASVGGTLTTQPAKDLWRLLCVDAAGRIRVFKAGDAAVGSNPAAIACPV